MQIKILAIFLAMMLPAAAADPEFVDLVKKAKPAVVLLITEGRNGEGSGTGFFVSDTGRIATNYHEIENATSITAQLADGRKLPILGLLAEDQDNDIAIIQADFRPSPAEILPLAKLEGRTVEQGERVCVIGAPQGLSSTVSEGIVSAIRKAVDLDKFDKESAHGVRESLLQITAAISPGSSGSPVIDRHGQVIGVAQSQLMSGQNLNFAVPISVVHRLLTGIAADAKPRSFKGPLAARNLLISAVLFGGLYWGYRRMTQQTRY
jgi:serine protease Do